MDSVDALTSRDSDSVSGIHGLNVEARSSALHTVSALSNERTEYVCKNAEYQLTAVQGPRLLLCLRGDWLSHCSQS